MLFRKVTKTYQTNKFDWPVGLVVRDPECYARGRGFDSHPEQIFM